MVILELSFSKCDDLFWKFPNEFPMMLFGIFLKIVKWRKIATKKSLK
jgi:hypothetical protein